MSTTEKSALQPARDVRDRAADHVGTDGRRGHERIPRGSSGETPRNDAARIAGHAKLIEHVMREAVRADAAADASLHVAAQRIQGDTPPGKDDGAMRHLCAAVAQALEIIGMRPMQPGMIVQEDAMADDRIGAERPDLVQPFDRRATIAAHDLLKLHDALGGVDLDRLVSLACQHRAHRGSDPPCRYRSAPGR